MPNWRKDIDWNAILSSAFILCAVLLILPTPEQKSVNYADQSSAYVETESADDRIADYTHGLELFTALLFFVSAAQGLFLYRADKTARISANAAKKSADALAATERAHIFVVIHSHSIQLTNISEPLARKARHPLQVRFNVVNYGKTPGEIKELRVGFGHSLSDLQGNPWEAISAEIPRKNVLAAEETLYDNEMIFGRQMEGKGLSAPNNLTDADYEALKTGEMSAFFFGRIEYEDVFGTDHVTIFCWRLKSGTFRQWGGKEFNLRT